MTRRPLVLDANILVRAVLGRRVRELLIAHAQRVAFFTPSNCVEDARKYLPDLLRKRGIDPESSMQVLDGILRFVQPLETEWLLGVEKQARARLALRDENDWPVLAAAMILDCSIWTEDLDFFGAGVATWTTATVEHFLASELG